MLDLWYTDPGFKKKIVFFLNAGTAALLQMSSLRDILNSEELGVHQTVKSSMSIWNNCVTLQAHV